MVPVIETENPGGLEGVSSQFRSIGVSFGLVGFLFVMSGHVRDPDAVQIVDLSFFLFSMPGRLIESIYLPAAIIEL